VTDLAVTIESAPGEFEVTDTFTQSHDRDPDIVTIMLGTNDSKPYSWRFGTYFITDYSDLIASYTNLPSHPRVLLCTPSPVFGTGAFDIKPGTVETNIVPLVRELTACATAVTPFAP